MNENRATTDLIDNQVSSFSRIAELLRNLKKVSLPLRNAAGLRRYAESLTTYSETIDRNHAKLISHPQGATDQYIDEYTQAVSIQAKCYAFIATYAPELLPPPVEAVGGTNLSWVEEMEKESNSSDLSDDHKADDKALEPDTKPEASSTLKPLDYTKLIPANNVPSDPRKLTDYNWRKVEGLRPPRSRSTSTERLTSLVSKLVKAQAEMARDQAFTQTALTRLLRAEEERAAAKSQYGESKHPLPSVLDQSKENKLPIKIHQDSMTENRPWDLPETKKERDWINGQLQSRAPLAPLAVETEHSGQSGVKIPLIDLPTFDGDIKEYSNFKIRFQSVLKLTKTSPLERFELLRSKLKGSALLTISNLAATELNYKYAWELLDTRYDNERKIFFDCAKSFTTGEVCDDRDPESILRLVNDFTGFSRRLSELKISVEQIAVWWLYRRMGYSTAQHFDDKVETYNKIPTLKEIQTFLERHYQWLTANDPPKKQYGHRPIISEAEAPRRNRKGKNITFAAPTLDDATYAMQPERRQPRCFICREAHWIEKCPKFLQAPNREALLREHKLCIFCLRHRFDHKNPCRNRASLKCEICSGAHIKDICPRACLSAATALMQPPSQHQAAPATVQTFLAKQTRDPDMVGVILPTAVVSLVSFSGEIYPVRALLDSCSQANYICESLVQQLALPKRTTHITVTGIGVITDTVNSTVTLRIKLRDAVMPELVVQALVVKRVAGNIASVPKSFDWDFGIDKPLADPMFYKSTCIPLLLGSLTLPQVMLEGMEIKHGLMLQNTRFGWIISGQHPFAYQSSTTTSCHISLMEFENRLLNFWDLQITSEDIMTQETEFCEKQFVEKHQRMLDGRYVVPIPFKPDAPALGNSYNNAIRFFVAQEKKWSSNEMLRTLSHQFMREYIDLGHMARLPVADHHVTSGEVYYIPYLPVLRQSSVSTKLRNVFHASCATTSGVSLNDTIFAGPKLQTHIFDVITRCRKFRYIYSSDVKMMFRQIRLLEEDQPKLRILWREDPNSPIDEFKLCTVTYGMDCAPFQSLRTMHAIADDNSPDEETKDVIKKSFYVDDLLHGGSSVNECQSQIDRLITTMNAGKFPLTKWWSNDVRTLQHVPEELHLSSITSGENDVIKCLGILYDLKRDEYLFKLENVTTFTFTKRFLLSKTAGLYDPLGWILPVIMKLRILIQSLWMKKLDWDDVVDEPTQREFIKLLSTLELINALRIPRWIQNSTATVELVGFCDASGQGHAAVIYSRCKTYDKEWHTRLIASRGRVAPLKTQLNIDSNLTTIPKSELQALVLLSDLTVEVLPSFSDCKPKLTFYSDSEVVIKWIRSTKELENKFVKRRVSHVKKTIKPENLHYVKSADNPADIASRGADPEKFMKDELWTHGPSWLLEDQLPTTPLIASTVFLAMVDSPGSFDFSERFSDLNKLKRVAAICVRFIELTRPVIGERVLVARGPITADEFTEARRFLIKLHQFTHFNSEITLLMSGKPIRKNHWIFPLQPFVDDHGILRVGGRLSRSQINESRAHPILLKKSHLVDLIIKSIHLNLGHAGIKLTLRQVQDEFWVPSITSRIKKCVRSCVVCIRWRAKTHETTMAALPLVRTMPAPPFTYTGVDLAGPYAIRASRVKFEKRIKVWVVVFRCMTTKSTHLELCTELSTENFLMSFARFTGRRNVPAVIYSDCATNFKGADRIFSDAWQQIQHDCQTRLAIREIKWFFIPPAAPWEGGLWESGVKAMKFFAKRMESVTTLTFEEFQTLIVKIEFILNSRPLEKNCIHPADCAALTPLHFLTWRASLVSPIDGLNPDQLPLSRRWINLQKMISDLWNRFSTDYVSELQKRYKKTLPTNPIHINDVVIIKDLDTAPADWKLGRVLACYPDRFGVVRHVDVKTEKKASIYRDVRNLVPLVPAEDPPIPTSVPSTISTQATAAVPAPDVAPAPLITDPLPIAPSSSTPMPSVVATQASDIDLRQDVPRQDDPQPDVATIDDASSGSDSDQRQAATKPRRSKRIAASSLKLSTILNFLFWVALIFPLILGNVLPARSGLLNNQDQHQPHHIGGVIINDFSGGVYLHTIEPVQVKASDLAFTVTTDINVTYDVTEIREKVKMFFDQCKSLKRPATMKIHDHCMSLAGTIEYEAEDTIKTFMSRFTSARKTREARLSPEDITGIAIHWLPAFTTPHEWLAEQLVHKALDLIETQSKRSKRNALTRAAANVIQFSKAAYKPTLKYGGTVLVVGGLVYQAVENYRITDDIAELQAKNDRVTKLMAEIRKNEIDTTQANFEQIITQQEMLMLQDRVTDFATTLQILLAAFRIKFRTASTLKPMDQLKAFFAELHRPDLLLRETWPEHTDVFDHSLISHDVLEDLVVVTFVIPILWNKNFKKISLTTLPFNNKGTIRLQNGRRSQEVIMSSDLSSFFLPSDATLASESYYTRITPRPPTECMKAIFTQKDKSFQLCDVNPMETLENINTTYISLGEQQGLVISTDKKSKIVCKNHEENINHPIAFVMYAGCTLVRERRSTDTTSPPRTMKLMGASDPPQTTTLNFSASTSIPQFDSNVIIPEVAIEKITRNPKIDELQQQLEDEASSPLTPHSWFATFGRAIMWTLGGLTGTVLIGIFLWFLPSWLPQRRDYAVDHELRRRTARNRWVRNWLNTDPVNPSQSTPENESL